MYYNLNTEQEELMTLDVSSGGCISLPEEIRIHTLYIGDKASCTFV